MLPVRDDVPARLAPLAVASLVAANGAVFAYQVYLVLLHGDGAAAGFIETWGLVPREFLRGAADPSATAHFVWLTPLSSMFVHGGLPHLLGNALYLWVFGRAVEDVLGHGRFLVFYTVCGLVAAAIQLASAPSSYTPLIGASGAISGVLGAYFVSYPGGRLRLLWPSLPVPAVLFLLLWIVIQVMSALGSRADETGRVAWWAHVGGFAAGAALARSMWVRKPTRSRLRI
jgi:membrane associated rhomboid family serine protease